MYTSIKNKVKVTLFSQKNIQCPKKVEPSTLKNTSIENCHDFEWKAIQDYDKRKVHNMLLIGEGTLGILHEVQPLLYGFKVAPKDR